MNVLYINIPTNAAMDEKMNEGIDGWVTVVLDACPYGLIWIDG